MSNKKDLKELINQNGFFFHITDVNRIEIDEVNELLGKEDNAVITTAKRPESDENIMFFRGTATQQFGKGEMNRNGYKIEVDGWDWEPYKKNPQILIGHDINQPCGKALQIFPLKDRVDVLYYVDLLAMSKEDAHRVKNGYLCALSTGSLTKEVMYEDAKTGERFSMKDLEDMPLSEWRERNFIRTITKAECMEISKVAIGSNPDALTMQDGVRIYFDQFEADLLKRKEENEAKETTEEPEAPESTEEPEAPEEAPEAEETQEEETAEEETETNGQEEEASEDVEAPEETAEGEEPSDEAPENEGESPEAPEETAENAAETEEEPTEEETPEETPGDAEVETDAIKAETNAVEVEKDVVEGLTLDQAIAQCPQVVQDYIVDVTKSLLIAQNQLDNIPQRNGQVLTDQFSEHKKNATKKKGGAWARNLAKQVGRL